MTKPKTFAKNPYKLEIIEQYKDQELSAYKSGEFSDLCRGGIASIQIMSLNTLN